MQAPRTCHAASIRIPSRSEVLEQQRLAGGLVGAVLPIHYPRALLRAHGILPVEVWGPPHTDPSLAAAHLQPYVCSVVRNALSFLLSGGLAKADFLLLPHGCDSLQGLASILLDFVPTDQPAIPLYIPRAQGEVALAYLTQELRLLSQRLTDISGISPSEDELMRCVRREEEADQLLGDLHSARSHLAMDDLQFYKLVRGREYLPAELFAPIARSTLGMQGPTSAGRIPLVISGLLPEPMLLFARIWELGGMVVADDLACSGRRIYAPGQSGDPFTRMAERLLQGPPDSTRGSPVDSRLQFLLELAGSSHARGVIFYNVKFCEPEAFYHPALREGLRQAGIATVVIDADIAEPLSNQNSMRIEAFLEMLS
jgi:benzoyl-CoA reductase/2-hydroxyglutaryl-CoA dehydratase subunit BcrC/BadD/HgdB